MQHPKDYEDYLKSLIPEKRSGFFDLPQEKNCRHPEHNPPSHISIPQGKGYRHICPQCGKETIIIPSQINHS